jgi:hypothetical protein
LPNPQKKTSVVFTIILDRIDFKVDKINLDLSPLRQQSMLKEDQSKSFKDDTMSLLSTMETSDENKIFFNCKLQAN